MSLFDDYLAEHIADMDVEYMRIEKEAERGIWITKDGRHIAVSEMTYEHITNTIKMLERFDDNDMYLPWVDRFTEELNRRKRLSDADSD